MQVSLKSITPRHVLSLALLLYSGVATVFAQETIRLEDGFNGYDGTRDNTIYEDRPVNSNGGQALVFSGATANSFRRALLQFDPSQIPAGSTIQSVELLLEMTLSGLGATDQEVHTLHRLNRDWGEGTADSTHPDPPANPNPGGLGAPARDGDATWGQAMHNQDDWDTPGGDFNPVSSASLPINRYNSVFPPDNIYTFRSGSSPGLISDVQAWIDDPATNFGWILIGDESKSRNARRFYSKETSEGFRPRLTITYESPPLPPVLLISPNGGESFEGGTFMDITWQTDVQTAGTAVRFELRNEGGLVDTLGTDFDENGSNTFAVFLPELQGSYTLRVVSSLNPLLFDDSEGPITIHLSNAAQHWIGYE
jgi:hypothetical protein